MRSLLQCRCAAEPASEGILNIGRYCFIAIMTEILLLYINRTRLQLAYCCATTNCVLTSVGIWDFLNGRNFISPLSSFGFFLLSPLFLFSTFIHFLTWRLGVDPQ